MARVERERIIREIRRAATRWRYFASQISSACGPVCEKQVNAMGDLCRKLQAEFACRK